jgi:hypothetical protein
MVAFVRAETASFSVYVSGILPSLMSEKEPKAKGQCGAEASLPII